VRERRVELTAQGRLGVLPGGFLLAIAAGESSNRALKREGDVLGRIYTLEQFGAQLETRTYISNNSGRNRQHASTSQAIRGATGNPYPNLKRFGAQLATRVMCSEVS